MKLEQSYLYVLYNCFTTTICQAFFLIFMLILLMFSTVIPVKFLPYYLVSIIFIYFGLFIIFSYTVQYIIELEKNSIKMENGGQTVLSIDYEDIVKIEKAQNEINQKTDTYNYTIKLENGNSVKLKGIKIEDFDKKISSKVVLENIV